MSDELQAAAMRINQSGFVWTGDIPVGPGRWTGNPEDAIKLAEAYLSIIARLPRTADGIPVICDGMKVYCPRGHSTTLSYPMSRVYCCQSDCWSDGCQSDGGMGTYYQFEQCRSGLGIEVTK